MSQNGEFKEFNIEEIARNELGETPDTKQKCINELREWIINKKNLNGCTDDAFIIRFLRCSKYDLTKAKKKMIQYYTMRRNSLGWYIDRHTAIKSEYFRKIAYIGMMAMNGKNRQDGSYIVSARLSPYDPQHYLFSDVAKVMIMVCETYLREDDFQICGVHAILNLSDIYIAQCKHVTLHLVKEVVNCWQNAMPIRIKEKIRKRLHIHPSLESLHQIIPKYCLPPEFGGTSRNLQEATADVVAALDGMTEYFKQDDKYELTSLD